MKLTPAADRIAERLDPFSGRLVILWAAGCVADGFAVSCGHGFTVERATRREAARLFAAVESWCPGCAAAVSRAA